MKIFFLKIIIIISFLSIIFELVDTIISLPFSSERTINALKDFHSDFPQIKQIGFYTDAYAPAILFPVQNTLIPVIVINDNRNDLYLCSSENYLCQTLIINGEAEQIKKYSNNLFLLKNRSKK